MISLEQIRLLEGKITRAIELIRVLKEENSTLRKGLDSAQKRMKELEGLVDGFKADQKEIESVIMRTLKNLDDIEETIHTQGQIASGSAPAEPLRAAAQARKTDHAAGQRTAAPKTEKPAQADPEKAQARSHAQPAEPTGLAEPAVPADSSKGELDIF